MFKFYGLLQIMLLAAAMSYGTGAQAHAVVTETTLKIDSIRRNTPTHVQLTFNSNIELKLSKFYLVTKGDKQTELMATKGERRGQVSIAMPALEIGEYALRFRVFAADGHLTEEILHFNVTEW